MPEYISYSDMVWWVNSSEGWSREFDAYYKTKGRHRMRATVMRLFCFEYESRIKQDIRICYQNADTIIARSR